jgi:hypothetical protein
VWGGRRFLILAVLGRRGDGCLGDQLTYFSQYCLINCKKLLSTWFKDYIMSSEIENEFLVELRQAAGPLVELGLYNSPGEFIRDVISDFIKHKIQFYNNQLKTFEKKYSMSFDTLSRKLETGASISEEDDWMEWEAAQNMLKVWKKAAKETGISA